MGFDARGLSDALAGAVERMGASVVRVEARSGFPASGVVWAPGLVVTASHAVDREDEIELGLPDGEVAQATLAGRDPQTELAVLRTEWTGAQVPAWTDAAELKVGHLVLALARPGRTVRASLGIASALGPSWRTPAGGKMDCYLEVDVRLPPGFSGGPLIDLQGRALGMCTSGLLRRHSLAVPTATVRRVVEALASHGQVRRGYLGVSVYPVRLPEPVEKEAGQSFGALVLSVQPGSGAERGGLLQGDVLLSVEGQSVRQPDDLMGVLDEDRVGAEVAAKVARAGRVQELKLTVGARP